MLNVSITPHREFLPADTPLQKLFMMLKVQPTGAASKTRPPTTSVFAIDTSGSMRDMVADRTKMDIVIDSLKTIVRSGKLGNTDRVALVQFDDRASTLISLTPATQISELESAIGKLYNFSGGTRMGLGLREALDLLVSQDMASRRLLLFTDGQTFDEDICFEIAKNFATHNIPIVALGVGDDYHEDLLTTLSDTTGGIPLHVVPQENPNGTAVSIVKLPETIIEEVSQAQQEVITNLALTVKTVSGVKLTRIVRAYPSQAEFPLDRDPYPIGNAVANDETVFILEFDVTSRAASRVRIAQVSLTYDVPGQNWRGEHPPENVIVQFVAGQGGAAQVNPEVMGYVQQSNISQLVNRATRVADRDPQEAEKLLETARRMTVRIGNNAMTESLGEAQDELYKTRKLSAGTRKTVKMGSKGKTVKMGDSDNNALSDEQIRKLSGT